MVTREGTESSPRGLSERSKEIKLVNSANWEKQGMLMKKIERIKKADTDRSSGEGWRVGCG